MLPAKVASVDEACVVTLESGEKFLCNLIYVAEKEKHTEGKPTTFTQEERANLLRNSVEKLKRQGLEPNFYFERLPQTEAKDPNAYFIHPPIVHLTIEFYKQIEVGPYKVPRFFIKLPLNSDHPFYPTKF